MRALSPILAWAVVGCATKAAPSTQAPQAAPVAARSSPMVEHPGCFLLQDLERGTVVRVHPESCAQATVPASTFKVPHAMLALQTGVVKDPNAEVPWDGSPQWDPARERPHSLASAIRESVVWFFQGTAVAIGAERMREFLKAADYGNANVAGELTTFWLDDGSLRITGDEQLEFLLKMARRELPVDVAHIETVERLMRTDEALMRSRLPEGEPIPRTAATISAKTGTATGVSWWVGRVQGPRGDFVFVSRVLTEGEPSRRSAAMAAGLKALVAAGAL